MKRLINYKNIDNHPNGEWRNIPQNISDKKFSKLLKQYKGDIYQYFKQFGAQEVRKDWTDFELFKIAVLFVELQKFQNALPHSQCIEVFELLMSKLSPIDRKILFCTFFSKLDFVNHINQNKLDEIKSLLIECSDYDDDDFYERNKLFKFVLLNIGKFAIDEIMSNTDELPSVYAEGDEEIINDDSDYVTAYRGFVVCDDEKIRIRDLDWMQDEPDEIKEIFHKSQNVGRGVSFTLDKYTALTFACRFKNEMKGRYSNDKGEYPKSVRCAVGKYSIKKKDIFVYDNSRKEREILLVSSDLIQCNPILEKYEFFTDADGDMSLQNYPHKINEPIFKPSDQSVSEYVKSYEDTKIAKVFA